MPRFLIETTVKGSFPSPILGSPLYEHIDYVLCKGPSEYLEDEMKKLTTGSMNYPLAKLKQVEESLRMWMAGKVPMRHQPVDYKQIVVGKDPKSSVGMPWKAVYADYGAMIDDLGYDTIARIAQEVEDNILEGRDYFHAYYIFSKLDKYTYKKLKTNAFRSIQVADVFVLFMLQKYYGTMVHELELSSSQMFLITDVETYEERMSYHRRRYSFGVDFTAYDKTETSDLMRLSFKLLSERTMVPKKLKAYLEEVVCSPIYLVPIEGVIYGTGSSNPSGQFLTSAMNTVNHITMNMICNHEALGIPFDDYLDNQSEIARMVATGDDGVESYESRGDAVTMMTQYPILLSEIFGIVAKIEGATVDGRMEPFEPGCLPPYLAMVEVQTPGGYVVVPARFTRMLPTLQYAGVEEIGDTELYQAKLMGVSDASSGFEFLANSMPDYPIPQSYIDFRRVMAENGVAPNRMPWDRARYCHINLYEEHGCNRNIAIMNSNKRNPNNNNQTPKKRKPRKKKVKQTPHITVQTVRPRARPRRPRQRMAAPHMSKLYMDPEGKTHPPATDGSYGNLTPVQGVLRQGISSSTSQDIFLIFQWTPTELRGVFVQNDGTWNIGTFSIPQLMSNIPYATRALRMSVEICNTTSYTNSVGQVQVAMSPQQIKWEDLINTGTGLHFTAGGINSLGSFLSSYTNTQTYAASEFLHPKKWIFYPVSHVGYHEWLDYGNTNYSSFGPGYLSYLSPGADQDALSTMIVRISPSAVVNNYVFTVRIQEACRYPLNTVLGNMGVYQQQAPARAIQQVHREVAETGHLPVQGGSVLSSIGHYAQEGANAIGSVGNFLGNAFSLGQGLTKAYRMLRPVAPAIEEASMGIAGLLL